MGDAPPPPPRTPSLTGVEEELLGLGVGGELGGVDHHGPRHGGDAALGEGGGAQ